MMLLFLLNIYLYNLDRRFQWLQESQGLGYRVRLDYDGATVSGDIVDGISGEHS